MLIGLGDSTGSVLNDMGGFVFNGGYSSSICSIDPASCAINPATVPVPVVPTLDQSQTGTGVQNSDTAIQQSGGNAATMQAYANSVAGQMQAYMSGGVNAILNPAATVAGITAPLTGLGNPLGTPTNTGIALVLVGIGVVLIVLNESGSSSGSRKRR